jgi:hypothetical protein
MKLIRYAMFNVPVPIYRRCLADVRNIDCLKFAMIGINSMAA